MMKQFGKGDAVGSSVTPAAVHDHPELESASRLKALSAESKSSAKLKKIRKGSVLIRKMNKLGKKADMFAHGIREHVRLSPRISETLKGKLSLGARILQVGGMEKVFRHLFKVGEEERLLQASQCYVSTTSGPIAGLLFISTQNIAFCSERSLKLSCSKGESLKVHYKVLIPLEKIETCNQSENIKRPSQKYLELVTVDNFDFWFMGFLNNEKTWRYLQQAISHAK